MVYDKTADGDDFETLRALEQNLTFQYAEEIFEKNESILQKKNSISWGFEIQVQNCIQSWQFFYQISAGIQ